MKNNTQKLSLEALSVQSFSTSFEAHKAQTVKGGIEKEDDDGISGWSYCVYSCWIC